MQALLQRIVRGPRKPLMGTRAVQPLFRNLVLRFIEHQWLKIITA